MGILDSMGGSLRENILANPLVWGIVAVVLWIVGSAFIQALRGKDQKEEEDE